MVKGKNENEGGDEKGFETASLRNVPWNVLEFTVDGWQLAADKCSPGKTLATPICLRSSADKKRAGCIQHCILGMVGIPLL